MEKKDLLTRILSIAGTVLVWLPVLAPIVFSIFALFTRGRFLFDYLMPAELLFLFIAGAGILIWAALRARSRLKLIKWSVAASIAALVLSMGIATLSGLASGAREAVGIWWVLTVILLVAYSLGIIVTGVAGILLITEVFKGKDQAAAA